MTRSIFELCGNNTVLDADLVGCGQPILYVDQLFRCLDCSVPFHKECLRKHFSEGEILTQEIIDEQERRWNARGGVQNEQL